MFKKILITLIAFLSLTQFAVAQGGNITPDNDSPFYYNGSEIVTKITGVNVDLGGDLTVTGSLTAGSVSLTGAFAVEVDDAEALRVSHADGTTDTTIFNTLTDEVTFYDAGTEFMQISPDFTAASGVANVKGFSISDAGSKILEMWRGDVGGGTFINAIGITEQVGDFGSLFLIVTPTDDDIVQMSSLSGFILGDDAVDTAAGLQIAVQDGAGGTRFQVIGSNGDVVNTGDYFINSGDVTIANGILLSTQGTSGEHSAVFTSANNTDADPTVQIFQNGTAAPSLNVTKNIDDGGATFNTVFENTNNNATSTTLVGVFAGGTGVALGGWGPLNRNLATISALDTVNSTYEQVFHEANDYIFGTGTTFGGGIANRMTISNAGTVALNNLAPVSGNKLTYTSAGTGLVEIFEVVSAAANSNFKILASGAVGIGNPSSVSQTLTVDGSFGVEGPAGTSLASGGLLIDYTNGTTTSKLRAHHNSGATGNIGTLDFELSTASGTETQTPISLKPTSIVINEDNGLKDVDVDIQDGAGTSIALFDSSALSVTLGGVLEMANDVFIRGTDNAGTGFVNMIKVNASDQIQFGGDVLIGSQVFAEDAGAVTAMDMPVSATPAAGTEESYSFMVDSNSILTIYSEADSTGGVQNSAVKINVREQYVPSATNVLVAGTALSLTNRLMRIDSGAAGAVTMTATPTVDDGLDGECVIIQGDDDTNTITFQDEGNLANSGLQLAGGVDFTFGAGDMLEICYDIGDDNWYELSRSAN